MSLSRLWQHQGKWAAAHELLALIYDGCTEGFGTADLQDGRALLEALKSGKCFRAVDVIADSHPKLIPIDEQPNHQIMHAFRLRKTDRPAYSPLDPRADVDVLALDLLRVGLAHRVLLCLQMPLIGSPAVRERGSCTPPLLIISMA
jgi:hypothetical protein